MSNQELESNPNEKPWNYNLIIASLITVAFAFQVGAFQVYGPEIFTALSFFQHITLVITSLPLVLALIMVWVVQFFIMNFFVDRAKAAYQKALPDSEPVPEKDEPTENRTMPSWLQLIIFIFVLVQFLRATSILALTFYLSVLILIIASRTGKKWEFSSDNRTAEKQAIFALFALATIISVALGNFHASATISKASEYDDRICFAENCEEVRIVMVFNDSILYAKGAFLVYRPYSGKAQIRVKQEDKASIYSTLKEQVIETVGEWRGASG